MKEDTNISGAKKFGLKFDFGTVISSRDVFIRGLRHNDEDHGRVLAMATEYCCIVQNHQSLTKAIKGQR